MFRFILCFNPEVFNNRWVTRRKRKSKFSDINDDFHWRETNPRRTVTLCKCFPLLPEIDYSSANIRHSFFVPLLQFPLVIVKSHPARALHSSHYIVYACFAHHHFSFRLSENKTCPTVIEMYNNELPLAHTHIHTHTQWRLGNITCFHQS